MTNSIRRLLGVTFLCLLLFGRAFFTSWIQLSREDNLVPLNQARRFNMLKFPDSLSIAWIAEKVQTSIIVRFALERIHSQSLTLGRNNATAPAAMVV